MIQICQKQNKSWSHYRGPVVHRQKNPPNLAEWAVCVNCYLQNGFMNVLAFCKFESHRHSYNKFSSQNWLDLFFLWATLANLGVLLQSQTWHNEIWNASIYVISRILSFSKGRQGSHGKFFIVEKNESISYTFFEGHRKKWIPLQSVKKVNYLVRFSLSKKVQLVNKMKPNVCAFITSYSNFKNKFLHLINDCTEGQIKIFFLQKFCESLCGC